VAHYDGGIEMANQGGHRFGSDSTELKLDVICAYLHAFTTALKNKFHNLIYIDVFSGSGAREVLHEAAPANLIENAREEWIEERRGSARIALERFEPRGHPHCVAVRAARSEDRASRYRVPRRVGPLDR
jgi:three-Cys-motif partner protein